MSVLKLVGLFLLHIVIGVSLFIAIGLAAVALDVFAQWVSSMKVIHAVVWALHGMEYVLFGLDVVAFLWFICRIGVSFVFEIAAAVPWKPPTNMDHHKSP